MIFDIDGVTFIIIVTFVAGSLVFFAYAWNKDETPQDLVKMPPNYLDKLSMAMEEKLEKFFTKLGVLCASNPWKVLAIG